MGYSKHAKVQAQRRGISNALVETVDIYGEEIKSNRRCRILRLSKNGIDELKYDNLPLWKLYRDRCGVAVVVSEAGDKITVKHQHKRVWKKL